MQELIAHENNYILRCRFSQDSSLLATCSSDKTCTIWEMTKTSIKPEEGEDPAAAA